MPGVIMDVQHRLAVGQVTAATLPPGTVIEWMALRRAGPEVVRNLRWDGEAPLPGFEFTVDDLSETYTFFVPAICGNLALVGRQPSLEAARRAEVARLDAAREDAARAAAQEAARLAAEYEAALEAQRAAVAAAEAAAAEQARLEAEEAGEQARLEAEEAGEQARLAAEQTPAEYLAALERDLRVRPVLAGFFGTQQRQYDDTDSAGLGRLPLEVPRLVDVPDVFRLAARCQGGRRGEAGRARGLRAGRGCGGEYRRHPSARRCSPTPRLTSCSDLAPMSALA